MVLHEKVGSGREVEETGASCYNFHSKSIIHTNMQARDILLT